MEFFYKLLKLKGVVFFIYVSFCNIMVVGKSCVDYLIKKGELNFKNVLYGIRLGKKI